MDEASESLVHMAAVAERFSLLLEHAASIEREGFRRRLIELLVELIGAALALPDPPAPDGQELDDPGAYDRARQWLSDLPWHYYRDISDYREPAEVGGMGDLTDDLSDIYRDIWCGLLNWRAGRKAEAHWQWHFGLHSHWFAHATGALNALVTVFSDTE